MRVGRQSGGLLTEGLIGVGMGVHVPVDLGGTPCPASILRYWMPTTEPTIARPKPFSMIRSFVFADFLTLGNGFCGTGAVLSLMQYLVTADSRWLVTAMILLPVALVFDFADGRVARWRHRSSSLGADLDSLADVISFGLAPAALGFAVGLRGALDVAILIYFVACGISRLARFNATADALSDESGKVKYFEGTPIPTSVLIVALIGVLHMLDKLGPNLWLGEWTIGDLVLHPLTIIYALSGSAMISTWRIPKI
jgi:CDP-diacylglycerol--serine O-phosphatidyltransferase